MIHYFVLMIKKQKTKKIGLLCTMYIIHFYLYFIFIIYLSTAHSCTINSLINMNVMVNKTQREN